MSNTKHMPTETHMDVPVGKCILALYCAQDAIHRFHIEGNSRAFCSQEHNGFFGLKSEWTQPKPLQTEDAKTAAIRVMKSIRDDGGICVNGEWVDFSNIKRMLIEDYDPNFTIKVKIEKWGDF